MKVLLPMMLAMNGVAAAAEPVSPEAPDPACAQAEVSSPEQQVACVMRAYIDVTDQLDGRRARTLFHPNAVMSGDMGSGARTDTPEAFFEALESAPKRPGETGYKAQVQSVSVLGNTAVGEVVEENLFGRNFTNRFHLLKIDGRWLIVSKLYYAAAVESR